MSDIDRQLRETGARLRAGQRSPRVDLAAATAVWNGGRKRRLAAVVGVVVVLAAGAAALVAAHVGAQSHERVLVAPTTTPTRGTSAHVAQGGLVDLVGRAPNIVIDHTGNYTWTSPVVLATPPIEFGGSYHVNGHARISDFKARPVSVPGGSSVRVSFKVSSFSGHPTVKLNLDAQQRPGVVTGFIEPCVGLQLRGSAPVPYAAGTVFALRGVTHDRAVAPGQDRYEVVFPTARVGRQHVAQNQRYRFVLPAGRYVIAFTYTRSLGPPFVTGINVTVLPGVTLERILPSPCK